VQAALLHSLETVRQEPNDSTSVYGVEDADLKDGEDADLKDGHHRRAVLLAKRHREAPPAMLALLYRQMVRGRMERCHANTKRVEGMKTAHDVDAGLCSASNDDNDEGEAAALF
jgi:hypothetical protein